MVALGLGIGSSCNHHNDIYNNNCIHRVVMSLGCDSLARNSPDEVINGVMYSMLYIIIFIMYVRIDYIDLH
jgi:hypothetical protein